ncbi:MAG: hypothetical protein RR536_00270 [Anaerovoracaceae bacterium]
MNNINNLRVIEGGLLPKEDCVKHFVSAYITDTRLMGAMGLFVEWELEGCNEFDDLYQYFYFDTEEFGFESYESVWGYDINKIKNLEQTVIGCLGGIKVNLSERETCHLINHYYQINKKLDLPIPSPQREYKFILDKASPLDASEIDILIQKICTPITNNYQLIHYFLMRSFGKDIVGASYLTAPDVEANVYPDIPMATFCRNSIEKVGDDYLCESLIDYNNRYHIYTTKVKTMDKKIIKSTPISSMAISSMEAAMILSKPEFITVYEITASPEEMAKHPLEFSYNTMLTAHESGRLFLAFNNDNDHVKKKVFLLSEDVFGLYYITDFGQFIVAAYNLIDIKALEADLSRGAIGNFLIPTGRYEFKDPVLYDFIQSGFDDFDDFLDLVRDDD